MDLLALDDPVSGVDLTPEMLEVCRAELADEGGAEAPSRPPPDPPEGAVRVVGLVFDWDHDPVLLPVPPTRDVAMLDAVARLLRVALVTGRRVAELATEYGDAEVGRLYRDRRLPAFVYDGIPEPARARVPEALLELLG
jgi:hypothetical protein